MRVRPIAARAAAVPPCTFLLLTIASIVDFGWPERCEAADITTAQYDNARTQCNSNETQLTTANVNSATFGKIFARSVDGDIFVQPLYLQSVSSVNLVYVATMHNMMYAFDADNPMSSAPIWSVNLGPYDTPSGWNSGMGILSTPVIARNLQALYVVAATREAGHRVYRLHALDLSNGAEKFGGPVIISGQVSGTSPDAAGGIITFDPDQHVQRTSLALAANSVYVAFAADRDHQPYHGWIFGYNTSTLAQTGIFNDSPDAGSSGIWQSGRAPAVDGSGSLTSRAETALSTASPTSGRRFLS